MNYVKLYMFFFWVMDFISFNYQGEGICDVLVYVYLKGIIIFLFYFVFCDLFFIKVIISSEIVVVVSSRGIYFFFVSEGCSVLVEDGSGGDLIKMQVSVYEFYIVFFGVFVDKVFCFQDQYFFVVGEFVWLGWDYLGEFMFYYLVWSFYFGIIDLVGFLKDCYYLYQLCWWFDFLFVYIFLYWNWL